MRACLRPNAEDLGGRVVRGAAWMATLIALRSILTIGATAILARLLVPADYGYVAMAGVATELAAALCVFGLPAILIQQPRLTRVDLDSAFWFSIVLGVVVVSLLTLSANYIAAAFGEPGVAPVLRAMSLFILIEEASAVHHSIASRLLLFKQEFLSQTGNLAVRIAISVSLAFAGFGVWSLVLGAIAGRVTQFVIIAYLIPYVPRFRFRMRFVRRNANAGGSYFGFALVHYVLSNLDSAVVGRLFGPAQLGYYQTSFSLPEELRSRLSLSVLKVVFPAYARVQTDHAMFRDGVIKCLRLVAIATVPAGVGMVIVAEPIVRTLYGEQWLSVVPLLRLAAVVGVVRAIQALLCNIYLAKGLPQLNFKVTVVLLPLFLGGIVVGSLWGSLGVAAGVLLFNLALLISTTYALRLIDLGWRDALRAMFPATFASAVMATGLLVMGAALRVDEHANSFAVLALNIVVGAALFVVALLAISRETVNDIRSVRQWLPRRG